MPPKFQPRAPSPLHFESVIPYAEDVLCPGSDDEETLEGHRDKRRRVEALGKQYLQGRGLVILSAGLKGPFEYGWDNPWASKRPRRRAADIIDIPEESGRAANFSEKHKQNRLTGTVKVREADGNTILRARSAPLAATRAVRGSSAEQNPMQGRKAEIVGEITQSLITPVRGRDKKGEPTNIFTPRSADQERPLQAQDMRLTASNRWLKTALKKRVRDTAVSPSLTPTPRPRSRGRTPEELSVKPQSAETHVPRTPSPTEQPLQIATTYSGFTPVNRRGSPQPLQSPTAEHHNLPAELQIVLTNSEDLAQEVHGVLQETTLAEADEDIGKGYEEIKYLSQEAVGHVKVDEDARLAARKSSQQAALRAYGTSATKTPAASEAEVVEVPPQKRFVGSPHEVPPSTYLPGFEYRVHRKTFTPSSREPSSFSEQLEAAKADVKAKKPVSATRSDSRFAAEMDAAKAKAKAQAIRRLSFTASGRLESPILRRSSQERLRSPRQRQQESPLRHMESSYEDLSTEEDAYASATSKLPSVSGDTSKSEALPEAQVAIVDPCRPKLPSGPSTNLLETDKQSLKFPSTDEGDSYTNLSTQAAIAKAQLSFQNEVLSPFKSPQKHRSDLEISPTACKTHKAAFPLSLTPSKRITGRDLMDDDEEESISTQAMIDAMSPFAVTTVKKNPNLTRRTSFARSAITSPASPTANHFRPQSPSMSTSVSPSPSPSRHSPLPPPLPISLRKGPSSLASFSIAPNGTLTEVYQHDGQQQQFADEDGWNLEDALEEAGSFLGTWEVEAEARKVGSAGNRGSSGVSGAKGIFSSGESRG